MRGHIRKRGETWTVVVDVGRDPASGKRRQKWQGGFRTKRAAERALTETLDRLERGTYAERSNETLAAYLEEWLRAIRPSLRSSTWESYARNTRTHIVPRLGQTGLQALTPSALNAFYGDLLAEGRRDGRGLSPRTVRYCHAILRKALSDAVRWNRIARNVADSADPPSASTSKATEMRTWSADELRTFLASVRDDRFYALWLLAATTGMRRGEIAGLRWSDVDLGAARLSVRRALVVVAYRVEWSEPKTDRGRRSIALDPATVQALREHRLRQLEEGFLLGTTEPHDLVFAREDGSHPHPERISKAFEQHVRRSDLPRIRFHDLRHTHATLALQAGVHPKVVSDRLGHADIALTLNVYSHAIPALQETAAALVASLIFDRDAPLSSESSFSA